MNCRRRIRRASLHRLVARPVTAHAAHPEQLQETAAVRSAAGLLVEVRQRMTGAAPNAADSQNAVLQTIAVAKPNADRRPATAVRHAAQVIQVPDAARGSDLHPVVQTVVVLMVAAQDHRRRGHAKIQGGHRLGIQRLRPDLVGHCGLMATIVLRRPVEHVWMTAVNEIAVTELDRQAGNDRREPPVVLVIQVGPQRVTPVQQGIRETQTLAGPILGEPIHRVQVHGARIHEGARTVGDARGHLLEDLRIPDFFPARLTSGQNE
jgi:hypothetical protein